MGEVTMQPPMNKRAARTKELEFGGKLGATFMVIGLPITVYGLNFICSTKSCTLRELPSISWEVSNYFDKHAVFLFMTWISFQVFLSLLPIGTRCKGQLLRSGERLTYRCNGFQALLISLFVFTALVWLGFDVTVVHTKYIALITTATLFSLLLSLFLYIHSFFVPGNALASGGNSGNLVYDFFIGRELNPRIGPVDLKFFCELRPGLIGWVLIDMCFVVKSHQIMGSAPTSLLLVSAFHLWYVADGLFHEESILTTIDIIHDGFGFMLAFGDLVWVPFLYTLQAKFLLEHPQTEWTWSALTAICALHIVGFSIFRGSNSQKDTFRRNPNDPSLEGVAKLHTATGKKLLISSWWGVCRHPNYLGDWLMSLSWSLLTGVSHIIPYFYPIYFLVLLIHRSMRDDANCRKKYGLDWYNYCKKVPFVIFPKIY